MIGGWRARRSSGRCWWRSHGVRKRTRSGAVANDSHYGLAAYVWTHEIGSGLRTAHAIESRWVQVNQGLGQQPGHSYGGYKQQSGIGREFSLEGMLDCFTHRKECHGESGGAA